MLYLPHTTTTLFQIKSLLSVDEAFLQFRTKVTKQYSQSRKTRSISIELLKKKEKSPDVVYDKHFSTTSSTSQNYIKTLQTRSITK